MSSHRLDGGISRMKDRSTKRRKKHLLSPYTGSFLSIKLDPTNVGRHTFTFFHVLDADVTVKCRGLIVAIPEVKGEAVLILGIHCSSVCVSQQVQIHFLLRASHATVERHPVPPCLKSTRISQLFMAPSLQIFLPENLQEKYISGAGI